MKAPCKNCKERHYLCHGKCEKYKEYKEFVDQVNERRRAETDVYANFIRIKKTTMPVKALGSYKKNHEQHSKNNNSGNSSKS